MRAYDLTPIPTGWKLTLYEDGVEAGGGVGGHDDFDFLLDQAEEFCGIQ